MRNRLADVKFDLGVKGQNQMKHGRPWLMTCMHLFGIVYIFKMKNSAYGEYKIVYEVYKMKVNLKHKKKEILHL